jgi:parvulin-like peptidyl-prolyl isomerase
MTVRRATVLALAGILTASAALQARALSGAEIIEQVLVKVNGEIFTKTDLEQRQVTALRQKNRNITEAEMRSDATLQKMLADVTPQLLVDAVDELLLIQRGHELGYRLSDEQFTQIVQQIRKENKLDSDAQFEAALKQEGLTTTELRRNIERSMIINRVQQQDVMEKIAVTEAETNAYYEAHKTEFTSPAMVTLREILVAVPEKAPEGAAGGGQAGVNVGLDEEAKAKAEGIRARAQKGDDFAKLAAELSDAASKANGGLIGPVNREELSPALLALVQKMKVGEVAEPVRTQRGYQIFKLETQSQTVIQPLSAVRNQVSDKVFREKSRPELTKYLKRLREQAIIEWKNDELKKLYEGQIKTLESTNSTQPS